MNKRVAPLLAIYLIAGLLGLIFFAAIAKSEFFSEILAFSSAIIGSVAGFYFSTRATAT
jgi:positive regulator of sigma E activity